MEHLLRVAQVIYNDNGPYIDSEDLLALLENTSAVSQAIVLYGLTPFQAAAAMYLAADMASHAVAKWDKELTA